LVEPKALLEIRTDELGNQSRAHQS
jgi:hypothetical protein